MAKINGNEAPEAITKIQLLTKTSKETDTPLNTIQLEQGEPLFDPNNAEGKHLHIGTKEGKISFYDTEEVDNKINALDYNDTAETNEFVTIVTQTDGQIAVTHTRPTASNISYNNTDNGLVASDVQAAIDKENAERKLAISDIELKIGHPDDDSSANTVYGAIAQEKEDREAAVPTIYQVETDKARLEIDSPKYLDICIVKKLIYDDKYTYTGYVYNPDVLGDDKWVAFDGNYSTNNVFLPSSITVGGNKIGNADIGTKFEAGTSIQSMLEKIMIGTRTIITKAPKATWGSITLSHSGEVGSSYTKPTVELTVTVGEYQNAKKPATSTETGVKYEIYKTEGAEQTAGIKISVSDTEKSSNDAYTNSSTITSNKTITYAPSTYNEDIQTGIYKDTECTYTFAAKAIHTSGGSGLPVNDKDKVESDKRILSGTLTPSDLKITYIGYRNAFINVLNKSEYDDLKNKFNKQLQAAQLSYSVRRSYRTSRNVNNSLNSEGILVPAGSTDIGDSARKYAVALVPASWKFTKLKCQLWNSLNSTWEDQNKGEVSPSIYNEGSTTLIGGADNTYDNDIGGYATEYKLFEYHFSNGLQSNIDKIRFVVTETEK